jgi:hypothetical protein
MKVGAYIIPSETIPRSQSHSSVSYHEQTNVSEVRPSEVGVLLAPFNVILKLCPVNLCCDFCLTL